MRVISVCFVFALACLNGAMAQSLSGGIIGGLSIPKLKSSGGNEISEGYSSRKGGIVGMFADFGLQQNFAIRVMLTYSGQGGKRNGMQPVTSIPPELSQLIPPGVSLYANFNNESILNYLELPVMAKVEGGNKFRYYLNAGPYGGILLSAHQETSGTSQLYFDKEGTQPLSVQGQPLPAQSFEADTDVKDDLQSFNWGFTGGGGIGYVLQEKHKFLLDIRGAYGFIPIQKDTETNGKSHTGGLFITIGYVITLRGSS